MESVAQSHPRTAKIAETEKEVALLRSHLQDVINGTAFRGSHRSGQFLRHIVEQSIAGNFESLKERAIGIELFGRSPSYDTGEDAIVRVTASDVRKRLLQHYGKYGTPSDVRLTLPVGSYVLEIHRGPYGFTGGGNSVAVPPEPPASTENPQTPAADSQLSPAPQKITRRYGFVKWLGFGVVLAGLNVAVWVVFWNHSSRAGSASASVLPWSALFRPMHSTTLVASDPNVEEIQRLTGQTISLSDYANQRYIPNPGALSPEILRFCKDFLPGDLASAIDISVAAKIAPLAPASATGIDVKAARDLRLSDVYTDDNFIFMGSPRSNPWVGLFDGEVDFRFVWDKGSGKENIRNARPRPNEKPLYVPTAGGYGTGESFATISFIPNPGRGGQILLVAGANGEGTSAAGELITNRKRLSTELKNCGIRPSGPIKYFQLLLGLNTMAGSPSGVRVIACHILPGNSSQ